MTYQPKGKVVALLAAFKARSAHVFTVKDVAGILGCGPYPSSIQQHTAGAIAAGAMFRIHVRNEWLYAGREINDDMLIASGRPPRDSSGTKVIASPFTDDERQRLNTDCRSPGPAGYVPKPMQAPRPGSDVRIPKFSGKAGVEALDSAGESRAANDQRHLQTEEELAARIRQANERINTGRRTTSEATASGHEIPDSTDAAQVSNRCEVANEGDARAASSGCAHPDDDDEPVPGEEESEDLVPEFNAARWMDGEVVIYGAQANEDGSFTLNVDQVHKLVSFLYGVDSTP